MTVAAIIQARMGSSRLPGKSLELLGGFPVLDWVTTRLGAVAALDEIIVATSTNEEDDAIAHHVVTSGGRVVRGHPTDVLGRFGTALASTSADAIVRITADCPLLDPALVDFGIELYYRTEAAYVATGLDGRMPRGLDLEVIDRGALETALEEATDPLEREHVTPFIVRRPERFPAAPLVAPVWARRPNLRITLDETADLELLRTVVRLLDGSPGRLSTREVLSLLDDRPDVAEINAAVAHREVT